MSKGLRALDIIANYQLIIDYEKDETSTIQEQLPNSCNNIEKELKALEIIKEKLLVSYDESENDKPCLILGVKDYKGALFIFYETFDKEKIDLLKEVLL